MKRGYTRILAVLVALMLVVSLAACGGAKTAAGDQTAAAASGNSADQSKSGGDQQAQPAQNIKLVFWQNAFMGPDEEKKPQKDWFITGLINKFEQQNPGVKIEMTVPPDQAAAHQTFKAAAMAKNGPDVANLWSGFPLFALKDVVLHLDGKVPQEDMDNIIGWEVVRENFKSDGALLGYPVCGAELGMFIVNKKLTAKAGVDFEANPPKTVDEFMADLDKIKASGTLPIVAGEGGCNLLYVFNLGTWWVQTSGNDRIASNSLGETKYADDKAFLDSMRYAQEMYTKGYVNKDYATCKDADARFYQGKAAMYNTGNWDIANAQKNLGAENVTFVTVPDFQDAKVKGTGIGGPGQSCVVANYSKNPDMAIKLISFLMNKENHTNLLKMSTKIPLRKDITVEDLGWKGNALLEKAVNIGKNYVYWDDNSQQPEVMNEFYKVGALVVTGKMTPEQAAEKLDKKAAEVKK